MARNLQWIEQAKNDTGGKINQALDVVAVLILETGDPSGVYDQMLRLLAKVRAERETDAVPAKAA